MGRNLAKWQTMPNAPSTLEAAGHRYTYQGRDTLYRLARDYDTFMAGVPYKEKEVILILHDGEARKAYIVDVGYTRSDTTGERREKYRVLIANKKGDQFSKNWKWVHPRQVQDGYKAAGLADDLLQA